MIQSLLIANRGEIACRIIRTARDMGIRTVAVYSDADAKALHVRQADEAVHIGPSPAAESYLVGEKIIAAAKETGADAIHPGYGFLSENADFAQDVIDAGLIWVGPKPESIRAMGLKDAAKKLMDEAGVPTTPGYLGDNQDPDHLASEAERIGYPVLIKAVAGGGGKGMRKVDAATDFADALTSCKREAMASFGNDVCLIEKWIESPRHIEVQIFGDSHGNVVHLFERDCSLQRRHQKVIEEAPAPGMDEATRETVCGAAVRAAQAVNYEGAGTIEFIADGSAGLSADKIWFMEMNTRLQVEHPVTEEITGVDLVEWQLRVASSEAIPLVQDELSINGHAIEARLYAEDPASGFLPSIGRLEHLDFGPAYRIDTGVQQDADISPFYDPMIAKVIAFGSDREEAIEGLSEALQAIEIWPVKTNAAFLLKAATHPDFVDAELDTGFIERNLEALVPVSEIKDSTWNAAAKFALADGDKDLGYLPLDFRLNAEPVKRVTLGHDGETRTLDMLDKQEILIRSDFSGKDMVLSEEYGENVSYTAHMDAEQIVVFSEGQAVAFDRAVRGSGQGTISDGTILSPMPGKIIAVAVAEGDSVAKGDKLVTLEAMKMEHTLTAPFDGNVASLSASEGAQVSEGVALVEIVGGE
ncbi:acetyl/propionyl/methylcrotonyl-CoA carboxylase subunit alpha [Alterisphingorhabdus coralli]|uniref:Acetyl/propionyl/methylcrotonyl-CoA carboxylase subunit alpha n=1 Tax=Alterisphingorhabdus coralli TaxID=3071408 RepID=A0AA97F8V6_9SPHN|nr:acetyl/propionyl/methylcrotonyl-CoA carboxylase subunit alpha [Parasphingorhabdus sp. SCSIO 66989]WOE76286.1 acetyl/propionyl/methylcrotonyl-CoA carboxylase subunit alpha [Parasphingorhabdus sp. SCSIO 66989]